MGWLQLNRQQITTSLPEKCPEKEKDSTTTFIENVNTTYTATSQLYPTQPLQTPNSQLPFISPATIATVTADHHVLWLVIDNIIYDCTDFISGHPGGAAVIESFVGKDCSWQFWRFHSREHMQRFGRGLRVGRTKGVRNPFEERVRWVGLRRLGDDGWD
ncbi:fatty acid desaturas-like protein [Aureobasidium namibiae CBS 147.97]|uniref:Fatty acid desaturas-like protein n=1 Tax=Aureobasidium namibiae CBS 147.97 TaxID=1043004 RepID=A0A074X9G1_9PEZI|nr:fatty acid desaturas-like protein [Aureobasidium namibiae CBS 147.97]KEQ71261.1 fatty acid desaturas-like protein [Aureobasidium namibiae CBS 147.97]